MKDTCEESYLMFLDCSEEEMERRLLERGKTSGRVDDNIESIRKRCVNPLKTFVNSMKRRV